MLRWTSEYVKSCCATKDVEEFDGLKTCNKCREAKRKCYGKNKNEYNQARREERAKGSQLCEECGRKIKRENWDARFHYALPPEFGTKYIVEKVI